jgi:hypothetical protein
MLPNEALLWWLCVFTAVLLRQRLCSAASIGSRKGVRDWGALLAYALIAQVFGWLVIGKVMPKLPAGVLGLCLLLQPLLSYVWDARLFGTRLVRVACWDWRYRWPGFFWGWCVDSASRSMGTHALARSGAAAGTRMTAAAHLSRVTAH